MIEQPANLLEMQKCLKYFVPQYITGCKYSWIYFILFGMAIYTSTLMTSTTTKKRRMGKSQFFKRRRIRCNVSQYGVQPS